MMLMKLMLPGRIHVHVPNPAKVAEYNGERNERIEKENKISTRKKNITKRSRHGTAEFHRDGTKLTEVGSSKNTIVCITSRTYRKPRTYRKREIEKWN